MTFRVEVRGQSNYRYYMWYQEARTWLRGKSRSVGPFYEDGTKKLLQSLMSLGKVEVGGASWGRKPPVKSIFFADTVVVTVDPAKYKQFMLLAVQCKPDEFEEVAPDTFRMWWD